MTMTTTMLLASSVLLYLCAFCQAGGVSKLLPPKSYHRFLLHPHAGPDLERFEPRAAGGPSWEKRPSFGSDRPDYYSFLTDGQKRFGGGGHRSEDDYLGFLVGDKRNSPDYWDFLGVDGAKRTQKRRKRSTGNKRNPETELEEKKIGGSSADRRTPHDLESWDDFVLGKRRAPGGDGHDMNFDDFLLGKRRHDNRFSDYDYSEFVLGKRP